MDSFITIVHPSQKGSASLKRQAHSHAARVAHARARKLRMADHGRQKGVIREGKTSTHKEKKSNDAHQRDELVSFIRDEIILVIPKTISGAFEHEPLASFLKSLTPREHFMFNYYVESVLPRMQAHCPVMAYLGEHQEYVRDNWILFSSTDIGLLDSYLLAACRHLSMVELEDDYAEFAIQYKLKYVQRLRETISAGGLAARRMAVTRALVLAFDDVMIRDIPTASKHLLGAIHIIQAAGGAEALGLSDLIRYILHSCMYGKRLLDGTRYSTVAPEI